MCALSYPRRKNLNKVKQCRLFSTHSKNKYKRNFGKLKGKCKQRQYITDFVPIMVPLEALAKRKYRY